MNRDLERIGITTEERYECIYTTISPEGVKNSDVICLKYFGGDDVGCRIFKGSKTLENIQKTKRYVINITQNPMIFTKSTIDKLPEEYYTDNTDIAILRDAGSYIIVNVTDIDEQKPDNTPIDNDQSIFLIKGKIEKVVVNDESIKAFNRAFSGIIECLVNVYRYKIVGEEKRQYYMGRVIENDRMISRIGNEKSKEVIKLLKEEYEKN